MPGYVKYFLIVLLAGILFLPFLGHVHLFDWDEINFAECAREMLATGDYLRPQIDYQAFWEKPPLFMWIQALSMSVFGINEYAARFPNALMGIITLVSIFYIGKRVVSEKMATWWTLLYAACWLPHVYFKSGIIDPTFNYFIFIAFFQVYQMRFARRKLLHAFLGGLLLGLAVLTKGPVAVLIALLCFIVYIVVNKGLWGYKTAHLFVVALTAATTFFTWIAAAIIVHGWNYGIWFLNSFITYQLKLLTTEDAGHGGPFFYHIIVLLLGCFPASVFLFQYSRKRITDSESSRDYTRWMWILFSVVLILFSLVKTKIVHYSSLCYFPLTYLAALRVAKLSAGDTRLKPVVRVLFLCIGILFGLIFIALPFAGMHMGEIARYVKDPIAVANMSVAVPWHWWECTWGVLYLVAVVIAFVQMKRNFRRAMITLCVSQVVATQVLVFQFAPKIEMYSQNAAIEFYKSLEGKDAYIYPMDFHSYGFLFYTKKPPTIKGLPDRYVLLEGPLDKPAYFICRIDRAEIFRKEPYLKEIGHNNCFVFFLREQ